MQDSTAKQGAHVAQFESKLQNYIHCNEIKSSLVLEDLCQPRDPITTTDPHLPSKQISLEPKPHYQWTVFAQGMNILDQRLSIQRKLQQLYNSQKTCLEHKVAEALFL